MKKLIALFSCIALMAMSPAPETKTLPDVQVTDLSGKSASIKSFVKPGKITLISFWATWCVPCKKELENIAEYYPEWQEKYNFDLIAVSIDDSRNSAKVKPLVDGKQWDYTVLLDQNSDLKRALGVPSVPYAFLLNKEGEIVSEHNGYVDGDEFVLEEEIKSLQ